MNGRTQKEVKKSIKVNFIERKGVVEMKKIGLTMSVVLMLILCIVLTSQAEEEAIAKTKPFDLWERSTMTGDWGGLRTDWAKKGVTFDMNLTQTGMSVISGGTHQGWEYSGRGDLTLNINTQKLGLWTRGFITVEVEGNYNRSINLDAGAMLPANTNQIFPTMGSDQLNIPNVTLMQFFSDYIAVVVGKLATINAHSGDMNEFAHGKGDTQFSNR